jgi:hypothetical protein
VIKHGKTSTGNRRYRCRNCQRTWVSEKIGTQRPDLSELVETYLSGRTYRELVETYKSSPLRINQKIREFLASCPNWEDYVDACTTIHESRLIYIISKSFSCSVKGDGNNLMFVGMAVDALSTVVLGYQVGTMETQELWTSLFERLYNRGIKCNDFMSNGSNFVDEAINKFYPNSNHRIFYHKAWRDKELVCCFSRLNSKSRLVSEAIKSYDNLKNANLVSYLKFYDENRLKEEIINSPEDFTKRLKERIEARNLLRIEGLLSAFQRRFEKFHMLKDDPEPLVNGWIARWMTRKLEFGYSRLSVYAQIPSITSFKMFSCGQIPKPILFREDNTMLKAFMIEIAARGFQVPIYYLSCEMMPEKCCMY